jgi:CBS domain-containing protein
MEDDMQAQDVMTKDLITVAPDTSVSEIAGLLVQHRISAVPVVTGEDQLVGIISQTDLGHRNETGTEKKRKWWLEIFADADAQARDYVKTHGLKAHDVMTRVVVSVPHDASLAKVADVLDAHRVRQVLVMRDGKMVGIISRADLVRALADTAATPASPRVANGQLQKAIWEQIKAQPWLQSAYLNVAVRDGMVELYGAVDSTDQRRALLVLVNRVAGVQKIEDNLTLMPRVVAA